MKENERLMQGHFRSMLRTILICTVLTGTLLCFSRAKGDMLLFATAEDCEKAPVSSWTMNEPYAVVLQKTGKSGQSEAR